MDEGPTDEEANKRRKLLQEAMQLDRDDDDDDDVDEEGGKGKEKAEEEGDRYELPGFCAVGWA